MLESLVTAHMSAPMSTPINTGNVLQVQDSLNQVGLPDLGKAGDQASDAKDNVQNAANKLGLE